MENDLCRTELLSISIRLQTWAAWKWKCVDQLHGYFYCFPLQLQKTWTMLVVILIIDVIKLTISFVESNSQTPKRIVCFYFAVSKKKSTSLIFHYLHYWSWINLEIPIETRLWDSCSLIIPFMKSLMCLSVNIITLMIESMMEMSFLILKTVAEMQQHHRFPSSPFLILWQKVNMQNLLTFPIGWF